MAGNNMNLEQAKIAFEEYDTDSDGFITLQGKLIAIWVIGCMKIELLKSMVVYTLQNTLFSNFKLLFSIFLKSKDSEIRFL